MNEEEFKFDVIIGNPPYQDDIQGKNKEFAPPIYHLFMSESYKISNITCLITPARFLFDAGSTPSAWNKKMLNDTHLKVTYYEPDSKNIFQNTDIKGGVVVTYHDNNETYEPIKVFKKYKELSQIVNKVDSKNNESIDKIIYLQNRFNLEKLYEDFPDVKENIGSKGKERRFRNNTFDKVSVFTDDRDKDDIEVLGVIKNKRTIKYLSEKYIDKSSENLYKYKVLVPHSNGSGDFGGKLSSPVVKGPRSGFTQTFISFGAFNTKKEADNTLKYLKTKFVRALLGVLKVTPSNGAKTWKEVPMQDFTDDSDINWNTSIHDIDNQLYKKYELNEVEIQFIEDKVKEML